MAMVHQRKEDDLPNQTETEGNSNVLEKSDDESKHSRSSSRNSSNSKRSSPTFMPQYQYSKDELMDISRLPLSQARPVCLDPVHNNSSGKWDPENWFLGKRGDKAVLSDETRMKRMRPEADAPLSHKRRTSDPRERVKEEKDEIILSPQRRSFGTGCHVIQHSSFTKRPGSPTDIRDGDNFRDRRIGSGRIVNREREQREWDREHRDYNYNGGGRNERRDRFDQDENEKDGRRYSNRYGRDRRMRGHERIDEEEPEWFSGGPTSQSETIELVGFEEASNENEPRKAGKKGSKKSREGSRRQSLKSEEEEKTMETLTVNKSADKADQAEIENKSERKVNSPNIPISNGDEEKSTNVNFDMDDLFSLDWIPGLLQNESPQNENGNSEIGCSRFSQWFNRESPALENKGSENNSRRSSFHEELLAHVLSGIGEPALLVPSPTPSCSEPYFTPISPAIQHSPECSIVPPHSVNENNSKNFLEMLQLGSGKGNTNEDRILPNDVPSTTRNIKEMEADLKRLVLGSGQSQPQEDISAFDKLLQHMSDTAPSSISIGPLDKSKVLQEEDLLQNMLGHTPASCLQPPQNEKAAIPNSGDIANHIQQLSQPPPCDLYNKLLEQQQRQQFEMHQTKQIQKQLLQNKATKQDINPQGFTVDMLAKILEAQSHGPQSPASSTVHPSNSVPFNRSEPPSLNVMLQQQRQREIMSSMLKQQQISQRPQNPPIIHPIKCPMTKDIIGSGPQTLGVPTLATGPSPRQSPLPSDTHGSAIHTQGRIPSPLVFGQQPPALSHAPAPIHPNHLAQAIAQNPTNANTLQVQNAMVLQRVPSPQELAVHTQSILQNALIKRKLEEQKENFRKRQEAQRTNSPIVSKSGNGSSPLKGLSPTIAFTPTSVMRKMHSEKSENLTTKNDALLNGASKATLNIQSRPMESLQNNMKQNNIPVAISSVDSFFGNSIRGDMTHPHNRNGNTTIPRPVYGQCAINPPRPQHAVSIGSALNTNPSQGRPIVKGGNNQMNVATDPVRPAQGLNKSIMANKMFSTTNNQYSDRDPTMEAVNKFIEQQRLLQQHKSMSLLGQRRQSASPMPSVHSAAGNFAFAPRSGHAVSQSASNLVRPMNVSSMNFPLLRTMIQANPAVRAAQTCTLNQLPTLGHIAALQQIQRAVTDNRQILTAQTRGYHPLAFQQLLLNSQNQVSVPPQATGGIAGAHGDGKHSHLLPGQSTTNRQSPVNLTKWFGNDVLKQKMPEMPPVSHQKALLLEEVERQQQHSTVVHN